MMPIFLTKAKYRAAVRREVEAALSNNDPAYILSLYAENPELLQAAVAAHEGVDIRFVRPDTMLGRHMTRALRAAGAWLSENRGKVTT